MATTEAHASSSTDASQRDALTIYSYSPLFYWWPVWLSGFVLALVTYLDGGRLAWVPRGAEARQDWRVLTASDKIETREGILLPVGEPLVSTALDADFPAAEPHVVRIARRKLPGFLFAVILFFVCLHSNVLWRGFRAYFFLMLGIAVFMGTVMLNSAFPRLAILEHVEYLVYQLPDIYISMDGYLFISSVILLVWLFVIRIYNRWTYITFEPGQVRIVQEIGGGETVFDTTNVTFEKQRNDLFRHQILGLGFLRVLRHLLPRRWQQSLRLNKMSGTGDLVFRFGVEGGTVIYWPNVLNIDTKLDRITTYLKSRPIVRE